MSRLEELKQKLESRTAKIGVIGLGYVGLPLVVEFVKAGFEVIGFDIDEETISALNEGRSYIGDVLDSDVAAGREAAINS